MVWSPESHWTLASFRKCLVRFKMYPYNDLDGWRIMDEPGLGWILWMGILKRLPNLDWSVGLSYHRSSTSGNQFSSGIRTYVAPLFFCFQDPSSCHPPIFFLNTLLLNLYPQYHPDSSPSSTTCSFLIFICRLSHLSLHQVMVLFVSQPPRIIWWYSFWTCIQITSLTCFLFQKTIDLRYAPESFTHFENHEFVSTPYMNDG